MSRIFLIEPFFGGSHRAFAEGFRRHSRHEVILVTLPGRNWKWRMRGGAAEIARALPEKPGADLIFASSMLNLAELKGLAPPAFRAIPALLYFHENQLTYPLPPFEKRDLHFALTQVTSILAADHILFNSAYHRQEFIDALPVLFTSLPDHRPKGVLSRLADHSSILPPGIEPFRVAGKRGKAPPLLLWNHRWEHDKGSDILLAAVKRLRAEHVPFRLAVTGAARADRADLFEELPAAAGESLVHSGFIERREAYGELLGSCDVILSTARHEFFGISVLEAVLAGAFPVLPRNLSYPELIDAHRFAECYYTDFEEMIALLASLLAGRVPDTKALRGEAERYIWSKWIGGYDDLIDALIARR